MLARLIETHDYDRHIRAARLRYRCRRDLQRGRLRDALPGARLPGVAAGLRALLLLPGDGPSEAEVLAACEHRGIPLRPASPRWHDAGHDGLLVGYAEVCMGDPAGPGLARYSYGDRGQRGSAATTATNTISSPPLRRTHTGEYRNGHYAPRTRCRGGRMPTASAGAGQSGARRPRPAPGGS
ncbi:hypothetical protein ACIBP6_28370 [Nonomuraea terrae]|uniref:hypothetical protein n=1 Tax=Nonomuraea terrae TaxID=2530383 RepID=UPI0037BADDCF